MAPATGGSAQLWLTLLLFALEGVPVATQKSVVTLNPPWTRIFEGENVTLTCNKNIFLGEVSTQWFHNSILSNVSTTYWDIVNATIQDSGNYTCENKPFTRSKPVHLEVTADWLLLQASADVVREGESFLIRCHGWRNKSVRKVTYYKDGIGLLYKYESPNYSIKNALLNNSGNYYCTAHLQRINRTSESVNITVIKAQQSKYYWLHFIIQFLVMILFAVDTGLLFLTQEELKFILKIQLTGERNKTKKLSSNPVT